MKRFFTFGFLIVFGIVIGIAVSRGGVPSIGSAFPLFFLLLCPLMMAGMMLGGHGHGSSDKPTDNHNHSGSNNDKTA